MLTVEHTMSEGTTPFPGFLPVVGAACASWAGTKKQRRAVHGYNKSPIRLVGMCEVSYLGW